MKLKKYGKGGKHEMYKKGGKLKGKTVTKEMADKAFKKKFEESANFANKFAKYAETGVGPNGMPLSVKKRKEYAELAKSYKGKSSKMKPNYRYVGTKLPAKDQPVYGKGGKTPNPDKKSRPEVGEWYMKQSKEIKSLFDNAYDSAYKRGASGAQARESAIKAVEKKMGKAIEFKGGGKMKKKYLKGGQVKLDANKDGKISGADFKMLRAKKK